GGADTRPNNYYPVTNVSVANSPRNYNIKVSGSGATIYAVNVNQTTGALLDIQKSVNGGATWAVTQALPPNYMGSQGWYDTTIIAADPNTVMVGGSFGATSVFR